MTALDPYSNVATGYRGTVHFTSSDRYATLPGNYAFTATDAGAHTFGNGVTLKTIGLQSVTVTDLMNHAITGTASVTVALAPAFAAFATVKNDGSARRPGSRCDQS